MSSNFHFGRVVSPLTITLTAQPWHQHQDEILRRQQRPADERASYFFGNYPGYCVELMTLADVYMALQDNRRTVYRMIFEGSLSPSLKSLADILKAVTISQPTLRHLSGGLGAWVVNIMRKLTCGI